MNGSGTDINTKWDSYARRAASLMRRLRYVSFLPPECSHHSIGSGKGKYIPVHTPVKPAVDRILDKYYILCNITPERRARFLSGRSSSPPLHDVPTMTEMMLIAVCCLPLVVGVVGTLLALAGKSLDKAFGLA